MNLRNVLAVRSRVPALLAGLLAAGPASADGEFVGGDANADGLVDVSDGARLIRHLCLLGGEPLSCFPALDFNCDGDLLTDLIHLLGWLLLGFAPHCYGLEPACCCDGWVLAPPPRLADFSLGLEGPKGVTGEAGQKVVFKVFATLETRNNLTAEGAEAWSLSLRAENLRVLSATNLDVDLPDIVQQAVDFYHSVIDPAIDLGTGPQGEGVVSYLLLNYAREGNSVGCVRTARAELPPEGAARILSITLEATIGESPTTGRLFYADGLKGYVFSQPARNVIALQGTSQTPELTYTVEHALEIPITPIPSFPAFLRGDCDGDGFAGGSVTDPVYYLNWAFGGAPEPPCRAACDADGDGFVGGSVTDPVYYLNWAFSGGPAPGAPFPACGRGGAADEALGCEAPPAGCAAGA